MKNIIEEFLYKMIARCKRMRDTISLKKKFGFSNSFLVYYIFNKKKYHDFLMTYIRKMAKEFDIIMGSEDCIPMPCNEYKIYTMWWQGNQGMPEIVELCMDRLRKFSKYEVVLITKENIADYIDIPTYIVEKVNNESISFTHFSDYVRVSLLNKYGGLWLDSTIYLTKEIQNMENYKFFTAVSDMRKWTGFCLGSNCIHYPLFYILQKYYECYWEKNDIILDYFLMDYFIEEIIEKKQDIAKDLQAIPSNNRDIWFLLNNLSKPYCEEQWKDIVGENNFQKVSYKKSFVKKIFGRETFAGFVLKNRDEKFETDKK